MSENILRKKMEEYWQKLDKEDLKISRKKHIRTMAKKFEVPEQIIEKEIGEWEAGKSQ